MISSNINDNLFLSKIMIDAIGNRVLNSTIAGQNQHPQNFFYVLPEVVLRSGVSKSLTCLALLTLLFPGGKSAGPAQRLVRKRRATQEVEFGWPTDV